MNYKKINIQDSVVGQGDLSNGYAENIEGVEFLGGLMWEEEGSKGTQKWKSASMSEDVIMGGKNKNTFWRRSSKAPQ